MALVWGGGRDERRVTPDWRAGQRVALDWEMAGTWLLTGGLAELEEKPPLTGEPAGQEGECTPD